VSLQGEKRKRFSKSFFGPGGKKKKEHTKRRFKAQLMVEKGKKEGPK